jgi:hypothetical protein
MGSRVKRKGKGKGKGKIYMINVGFLNILF